MMKSLIEIAHIEKAHGLKGAAVLKLHNPDSCWLEPGNRVLLKNQRNQEKNVEIASCSYGNKVIVTFQGIETLEPLQELLPCTVWVSRELLPETQEDEFYWSDLEQADVFEGEKKVGVLESFYSNGAQDILVIKLIDGEKLELPYIKSFVPKIDEQQKKITIIRPEVVE